MGGERGMILGTEGPGLVRKDVGRTAGQNRQVCSFYGRSEAISGGRNRAARSSFARVRAY